MEEKVDYVGSLNDEQLWVVTQGDGACLVLAGAGTGKTRTVAYRVAYLIGKGVSPSSILLVTFTNKAAREMTARIHGLIGEQANQVFAGTFHSVANRLLRLHGPKHGIPPNFSILSSEDARDLLTLCIQEVRGKKDVKQFPKARVLINWISFARSSDFPLEQVLDQTSAQPFMHDIVEIARRYDRRKKDQNVMDFDDLLIRFRNLLREDHALRIQLSQQFQYILVDEFQDTNTVQAQLISLLSAQHGNLLVVGDDAQSIYSFRAADIRNILDFPERYENTKVFKLTHNYRSTPEILALANASIGQNSDQFDKNLQAIHGSGARPVVIGLPSPSLEAVYLADSIAQALTNGVHAHEIAVLFRAAHHSQSLEFELMKRNIAYEYRGGMRFFERSHIKDAISFARLFENITDEMAWIRVLKLFPGIGPATALKIANRAMQQGSVDAVLKSAIPAPGRASTGWQACQELLSNLDDATGKPGAFIRRLVTSAAYQDYINANFEDARERLDDLEEFAFFAEQSKDMQEFLSSVSLTDSFTVKDEPVGGKVILSTIHQAKGLEWDRVFVIHACEGSFPNKRTYGDSDALEEERRLFYVAATRAKKLLTITYPESIGYEHMEYKAPSLFIEELPEGVYENKTRGFGSALHSSAFGARGQRDRQKRDFYQQGGWDAEDAVIVLDEMGEVASKESPPVTQFLKDLDDL